MNTFIRLLIVGLLSCFSQTIRADQSIAIGYYTSDQSLQGLKLSYQKYWDKKWFTEGNWFVTGYWDTSVQVWNVDAPTNSSIVAVGFVPTFRLQQYKSNPWYFDAGLGAQLFSHREIGKRANGSLPNFTEQFGVGKMFGDSNKYDISIRYEHSSNAGLADPNRGYDVVGVRLAMKF